MRKAMQCEKLNSYHRIKKYAEWFLLLSIKASSKLMKMLDFAIDHISNQYLMHICRTFWLSEHDSYLCEILIEV